jgi:hypothetical protein
VATAWAAVVSGASVVPRGSEAVDEVWRLAAIPFVSSSATGASKGSGDDRMDLLGSNRVPVMSRAYSRAHLRTKQREGMRFLMVDRKSEKEGKNGSETS